MTVLSYAAFSLPLKRDLYNRFTNHNVLNASTRLLLNMITNIMYIKCVVLTNECLVLLLVLFITMKNGPFVLSVIQLFALYHNQPDLSNHVVPTNCRL
jgi:hypothetical protein